jgi:hypothetical protein
MEMKSFTEELKEMFVDYPLYSQSEVKDPLIIAKFFDPCGSATWFLTELDVETKTGFGLVTGLLVDELGYVSIDELESIKRPFGLTIERDLYFKQDRLSEIKKQYSS